jgi:curli biogenesis system outer membrane secretion channel CsgG
MVDRSLEEKRSYGGPFQKNRRARPRLVALAPLVLLAAGGCSTAVGTRVEIDRPGMPPLARTVTPPAYLTPHSQRYRIAVLNFRDQTDRADLVTESIADMLTTELYATRRFNLYDRGDVRRQVVTGEGGDAAHAQVTIQTESSEPKVGETGADEAGKVVTVDATLDEQFNRLRFDVDGILTGYVTAFSIGKDGAGWFNADFRIVNPHTKLVVYSDSATVRFATDLDRKTIQLVRDDVRTLAHKIQRSFVDLSALERQEVRVTDVIQDPVGAKIVLNIGAVENNIKQGFAGFVVEKDARTKVEHYIAKFVIVNVFPEASVGVIVSHCNLLYGCRGGEGILVPEQQVHNVRVGASVRMK